VRNARGLSPTPRAVELLPALDAMIGQADLVLGGGRRFDPMTTTREFVIACADYHSLILMPLLARLQKTAPNATLRLVTLDHLVATNGLAGHIDLHIGMPPAIPAGCQSELLLTDDYVCLVRRRRGRAAGEMTLGEYTSALHVRVRVLDRESDPIDHELSRLGLARKIALTVPHFSVAPLAVHRVGYVATTSRRLAETYADLLPLQILKPPVKLPGLPVRMIWHQRTDADPAAGFLRDLVRAAVGSMGSSG